MCMICDWLFVSYSWECYGKNVFGQVSYLLKGPCVMVHLQIRLYNCLLLKWFRNTLLSRDSYFVDVTWINGSHVEVTWLNREQNKSVYALYNINEDGSIISLYKHTISNGWLELVSVLNDCKCVGYNTMYQGVCTIALKIITMEIYRMYMYISLYIDQTNINGFLQML